MGAGSGSYNRSSLDAAAVANPTNDCLDDGFTLPIASRSVLAPVEFGLFPCISKNGDIGLVQAARLINYAPYNNGNG